MKNWLWVVIAILVILVLKSGNFSLPFTGLTSQRGPQGTGTGLYGSQTGFGPSTGVVGAEYS